MHAHTHTHTHTHTPKTEYEACDCDKPIMGEEKIKSTNFPNYGQDFWMLKDQKLTEMYEQYQREQQQTGEEEM